MEYPNEHDDKISMHQPIGQVTQAERDEHRMTVDIRKNKTMVVKLLNKRRNNNEQDALPWSSRAKKQTQLPVERLVESSFRDNRRKTSCRTR